MTQLRNWKWHLRYPVQPPKGSAKDNSMFDLPTPQYI
jgi:hypothetical protein